MYVDDVPECYPGGLSSGWWPIIWSIIWSMAWNLEEHTLCGVQMFRKF